MIAHFRSFSYFYVFSFIFICIGFGSMLTFSSGEIVYFFNNHHSPFLNLVFKNMTHLGEWLGGTIVFFVLLFFFKYKYAVLFLICILSSSLTTQFLKRVVYPNEMRPAAYFEDLNEIEDVTKSKRFSFPSGHTSAAFTIFSFLAFAARTKVWQFVAFGLAAAVGISRVYLAQHFLSDVLAGAALGLLLTAFLFQVFYPKFGKIDWMNKKIITLK